MHITKTAGGSLKQALRESGLNVLFHYREEPGWKRHFSYKNDPEIIFGHFSFGAHEQMDEKPRYACFLRDPVSRTISHYYHLKNNDRGRIGKKIRSFDDLDTFLLEGRHWEFDNFLCRVISGVANKARFGEVGFSAYNQATYNLRNYFEFIGLFEDMEESLRRLQKLIPDINLQLPSVNVGSYNPRDVSFEAKKILNELTLYDQLLYQDAVKLFQEQTGNSDLANLPEKTGDFSIENPT